MVRDEAANDTTEKKSIGRSLAPWAASIILGIAIAFAFAPPNTSPYVGTGAKIIGTAIGSGLIPFLLALLAFKSSLKLWTKTGEVEQLRRGLFCLGGGAIAAVVGATLLSLVLPERDRFGAVLLSLFFGAMVCWGSAPKVQ